MHIDRNPSGAKSVPESETAVVFRILGALADHGLVLDEIVNATHLNKGRVERYMEVLQRAGAVRAEAAPMHSLSYTLTRYGLARLTGNQTAV